MTKIALYFIEIGIITIALLIFSPSIAISEDEFEIELVIRNHVFEPSEIEAPSGQKIKLVVLNTDDTVEEFESFDLKREKIVPPGSKINIILAPLAPGKYEFFGDFHQETARGFINVK